MVVTKITRNNQITLPAEIRRKLGVKEGDYIEIVEKDGMIILRKLKIARKTIKLGRELKPEDIERIIEEGKNE
ncbi:MAG: AbrB family transcriptional regulator [Candidatus Asgardarchaeum californiense]|nr:MAG: AbrB family transcriptional regulator [Candidatus Asgardarchaeum californiense]